jgi:ribonucleoside-diphosphate reductase alpha chain
MSRKNNFRNEFAEGIFYHKYAQGNNDTWWNLAYRLVDDVCGGFGGKGDPLLSREDREEIVELIYQRKFIPGGRYLYYAGRDAHYWNNCYLLRAEEDTREEWGRIAHVSSDCLMSGGGIGTDYSRLREGGITLSRTGGLSSGPLPLMCSVNEIGRNVMQGGSRRSAIYASLDWTHGDINEFLKIKNWKDYPVGNTNLWEVKQTDFNFPAPLDHTNISVNYDDSWLDMADRNNDEVFLANCMQAMMTGEPGFSFNFGDKQNETLRNACTEVTSEDDSDVCNLASVNLSAIDSLEEFKDVVQLASKFLICGTLRADLPYEKVYQVREKNRRLGLGLMGIHEWLLKRGSDYSVTPELHKWLAVYESESENSANQLADWVGCSRPVAYRAIAPTGSISILAQTTSGIEPVIYNAYKRRYLVDGKKWKYQFVVDATARYLVEELGVDPNGIETSVTLSEDFEKRIKFQADVQDYVDMAISSTINLSEWGSKSNNEDRVEEFAGILARYAPRIRGFTAYPDGSRGGQPITEIPYEEAMKHQGVEFSEHDICDISGRGGTCST